MRCKYSNQDLSQRLDNSVCRYKGLPVHVRYAGGNQLQLNSLRGTGSVAVIEANDPDFDVSTIPLGYVQAHKNIVCYLSRKPARIYKQGVSNDALTLTWISPSLRFPVSVVSPPVEDMILNKYPSLDQAFNALFKEEEISREIAISREVALKWNPKLKTTVVWYKGQEVGFIVGESKKVIIPSGEIAWVISKYLSEFSWEVE